MDRHLSSKISDLVKAVSVQSDPKFKTIIPEFSLSHFHKSLPTFCALSFLVILVDVIIGLISGNGLVCLGAIFCGVIILGSVPDIHGFSFGFGLGRMTRRTIVRLYLSWFFSCRTKRRVLFWLSVLIPLLRIVILLIAVEAVRVFVDVLLAAVTIAWHWKDWKGEVSRAALIGVVEARAARNMAQPNELFLWTEYWILNTAHNNNKYSIGSLCCIYAGGW